MEHRPLPPDQPTETGDRLRRILTWQGLRWAVPGGLGLAALIVGVLLVPDRPPVATRQFNLSVQPAGSVGQVKLQMAQTSSDGYDLGISDVDASAPVQLQFYFQSHVQVSCPKSAAPASCTAPNGSNGNALAVTLQPGTPMNIGVAAPIFPFGANGETAEGWLPFVNCPSCAASTAFVFAYDIPDIASYDWTAGVPPGFAGGGQAVWQQTASQLQEPILISGTDPAAQQHDQTLTLVSGIVIGIAVGLLATFLQVLLQPRSG